MWTDRRGPRHSSSDAVCLPTRVQSLTRTGRLITGRTDDGIEVLAETVLLALPPRNFARLAFQPALPDAADQRLTSIATWMAGQAKALAVYDRPSWRKAGLSGDATSRRGPMVEIHDASSAGGCPFALFGFIGVPPSARRDESALRQAVIAQLSRIFSPDASEPRPLVIKDWAQDPNTASVEDQAPP